MHSIRTDRARVLKPAVETANAAIVDQVDTKTEASAKGAPKPTPAGQAVAQTLK